MRISHCLAAGLGLAVLHSTATLAAPQKVRPRLVASHPAPDHLHEPAKAQPPDHAGAQASANRQTKHPHIVRQRVVKAIAKTPARVPASDAQTARIRERPGNEVGRLRGELSEITRMLWGAALSERPVALQLQFPAVAEPKEVTLKLPDLRHSGPVNPQLPVNPATASLPALVDERAGERTRANSAVVEAIAYLTATATPGSTMVRQGAALAIGRLHPAFSVRLAQAIKRAREAGLGEAGVFSAYRPPAFGIGGFSDKFDSLHSYGLAADVTGIGGPGSPSAHLWQAIVEEVGLYLVYGADNRAEFNHTQLIPDKVAPVDLRETITPAAPKDLREMWLASGVGEAVNFVTAEAGANLVASAPDYRKPPVHAATSAGATHHRKVAAKHGAAAHASKLSKVSKEPKGSKLARLSKPFKHNAGHGATARTRVSAGQPRAAARHKAG
jgi:hypothetical protein